MGVIRQHDQAWAVCHAEGRGFESLHPLLENPLEMRVFSIQDKIAADLSRDRESGSSQARPIPAPGRPILELAARLAPAPGTPEAEILGL
jgi:hypothetical protein